MSKSKVSLAESSFHFGCSFQDCGTSFFGGIGPAWCPPKSQRIDFDQDYITDLQQAQCEFESETHIFPEGKIDLVSTLLGLHILE